MEDGSVVVDIGPIFSVTLSLSISLYDRAQVRGVEMNREITVDVAAPSSLDVEAGIQGRVLMPVLPHLGGYRNPLEPGKDCGFRKGKKEHGFAPFDLLTSLVRQVGCIYFYAVQTYLAAEI